MERYSVQPLFHITPGELRTIVTQVFEAAKINNTTEAIHLAL